jgi:hypothetical protein
MRWSQPTVRPTTPAVAEAGAVLRLWGDLTAPLLGPRDPFEPGQRSRSFGGARAGGDG